MIIIPASHPLDFDWRFDDATVEALLPLFKDHKVLALGTPSVARRLQELGTTVTLVDRQPLQRITKHIVQEVEEFATTERFSAAIIDPPWYPTNLEHWATIAARALVPGGVIYASVWPPSARPGAADDLKLAVQNIAVWGTITWLPIPIVYQLPQFERVAKESSATNVLANSPCEGLLLEVRPTATPSALKEPDRNRLWHRFVADDYQLALRVGGPEDGSARLERHPEANGWLWPYVSARAPGRNKIDLWSSSGEVAIVRSPRAALDILARAFASSDADSFEYHLKAMPELLNWSIPRPPYRERMEWKHP